MSRSKIGTIVTMVLFGLVMAFCCICGVPFLCYVFVCSKDEEKDKKDGQEDLEHSQAKLAAPASEPPAVVDP